MTICRRPLRAAVIFTAVLLAMSASAQAGPIFLTGHDPDFHAQVQESGRKQLRAGLDFVTGGDYTDPTVKFLWVESFLSPTSGHLVGENGLNAIGLTLGVEYDWVDAAGFAGVDLSLYEAIGVASSFGGMLTQAELDALIARKLDIAAFINAGGGLMALAECFPASSFCLADTLGPAPDLFGFLPVSVTSVATVPPYFLTPAGLALFPTLTNADVSDCCTHNSFGLVGGLTVVDVDQLGTPTTLAGNVRIDDGVIVPVPEPGTLALLVGGLAAAAARFRSPRRRANR